MNIKELYRQVNIKSVNKREKPITDEEFLAAISTLIMKGLVIKIGDEVHLA
jgi:hypothetical protein